MVEAEPLTSIRKTRNVGQHTVTPVRILFGFELNGSQFTALQCCR